VKPQFATGKVGIPSNQSATAAGLLPKIWATAPNRLPTPLTCHVNTVLLTSLLTLKIMIMFSCYFKQIRQNQRDSFENREHFFVSSGCTGFHLVD